MVVVVVVSTLLLPILSREDVLDCETPVQFVSHSFQTVPNIPVWFANNSNCSNCEVSSIKILGRVSTSFHSSLSGESSKIPVQSNTLYGFTFTNSDAYGCTIWLTSAVEALFIVAWEPFRTTVPLSEALRTKLVLLSSNLGLATPLPLSIAISKSGFLESAVWWPLNESTTKPFLNLVFKLESTICASAAVCSNSDKET